jgi:polyisoprenoid-binding protein YceI
MAIWKIDTTHSEIKFKVKHLVISTVTGQFKSFSGEVNTTGDDFAGASISFEADVNSIDTNNEQRDGHLKSPDFFDAATYPKMSFVSTSFTKKSDSDYELTGNLTLKGITREVKLAATYNGTVKGFGDAVVAVFEIDGKINRQDFGLTWSALTEAGGVVVGDDVRLQIAVELNPAQ